MPSQPSAASLMAAANTNFRVARFFAVRRGFLYVCRKCRSLSLSFVSHAVPRFECLFYFIRLTSLHAAQALSSTILAVLEPKQPR